MENFDATGASRTSDGQFEINSSGKLPNGQSFRGASELKAVLKTDRDTFTRALTWKLLTYALARGVETYDAKTVEETARRVGADQYKYATLIQEIAQSFPFQMQRTANRIVASGK